MSRHRIEFKKTISEAYIETERTLNPEDYLECEDEEELEDMVIEDILNTLDYGDINVEESKSELDLDEFIAEWKSLKGLNN